MMQKLEQKQAKIIPAPWSLTGEGFILGFKSEQGGGLGFRLVMVVDYAASEAGPYRELLYIPEKKPDETHFRISKIYVSTEISVFSGRKNWGIPKELAEATVERTGLCTNFSFHNGMEEIAAFCFVEKRLIFPFTTGIIPKRLWTLAQSLEDQRFFTAPYGHGHLSPVQVKEIKINPTLFPNLRQEDLLFAVKAMGFNLVFPKAIITKKDGEAVNGN